MTGLMLAPATSARPVAWSQLTWVVWRRYRTTLGAITGVLAVLGAYLVYTGEHMRSAYATVQACTPTQSVTCGFAFQRFHDTYSQPGLLGVLLLFLPGVVGCLAGAPVLAREFETGTFRYAWTQGVGRMRWSVAATLPGGLAVAVLMAAFGALVTWYNQPLYHAGITPRLHATVFPVTGVAAAGWTLIGFALGVLAGLLWRRVLPGLVTAFGAWFGAAFLAANVLRDHYLAPLTTTRLQLPARDLSVSQWWTEHGVRVGTDQINKTLQAIGAHASGSGGNFNVQAGGSTTVDPIQYLVQHGYAQVTSYQPDSRYWTFQWIEFGWLAAVSVVLLAVAFWVLRRRPA